MLLHLKQIVWRFKKTSVAAGALASFASYVAYVYYREDNGQYDTKEVGWCDPKSPNLPAKYREFRSDGGQTRRKYEVHTPDTFKDADRTLESIVAARMGSVTNAALQELQKSLSNDGNNVDGVLNWLEVMAGTTNGVTDNGWAILAQAQAERLLDSGSEGGGTQARAGFSIQPTVETQRKREQFFEPNDRDKVQQAVIASWRSLRNTLVNAAFLAEAGYSIADLANLPSTHTLHHQVGRYGLVIQSPTHHDAVALGFRLLPPRRVWGSTGTDDNDGSEEEPAEIDMAVHIVFQGSRPLNGLPTVQWMADWCTTNFRAWLTTTPKTTDETPLPEGLKVHTGFYKRFERVWPVILREITRVRSEVAAAHGKLVNVQVTVAGHSQAGALATLTAIAMDSYIRRHSWHRCCGTDLFVFSAPAMFGACEDGSFPTLDDTTVRCIRFSVDNDKLALLPATMLGYRHPSANELQLSGKRCNVGTFDAHTDYSRLIRELVGPERGVPQLHLLSAGQPDLSPH